MFVKLEKEEVERSIPDRFEKIVRRYPDRIAVKTRSRASTYDELNKAANRVARAVLSFTGPAEEPVVLLMEPDLALFAAILGILKAGRFYVPLDPSHPKARRSYIRADSGSRLFLTDSKNLDLAKEMERDGVRLVNVDDLDGGISDDNLGLTVSPDSLAYIIYTSGTTGQPKGVVQNHRNILHKVREYTNSWGIAPGDRLALLYSPSASGSVRDIFSSLLNGAGLHPLMIQDEGIADLPHWLIDERITVYNSAATLFRQFVGILKGKEKFPCLRLIHVGSETIYGNEVEQYRKYFRDDCIFVARYGSSEISPIRQFSIDKNTPLNGGTVPAGYAVEGAEVLLLNEEGEVIGVNRVGEIAVKSRFLTPGYWQRPELNSAVFSNDPKGGNERIYRTGDLGLMRPDGCLLHLERKDFQIKIRGYRVEVAEIEAALRNLGAIKEAVVTAREDRPGDQRLVAYVVPSVQPPPSVTALRQALMETLPEPMIPAKFEFLDALPLTATGKIDRRALPTPDHARPKLGRAFVAPKTAIERVMAKIWQELLGVESVGIEDDFYDLGGHSLLATQVISRVRDTFQVHLPLRAFLQNPRIAALAGRIEKLVRGRQSLPSAPIPILPAPADKELRLSFAQERLWLLNQLEPENSTYNVTSGFRLSGALNVEALERALGEIVRRHEPLRTNFFVRDERPVQVVAEWWSLELPISDLTQWPAADLDAEVQRLFKNEARRPFDLSADLMLRAKLLRLNEAEHVLFLTVHHIAHDHWALQILYEELSALYRTFSTGSPSPLPELPIRYKDYAVWQRQVFDEAALKEHLSYWKEQLRDSPPVSDLPTDYPRPRAQTFRGARQVLALPKTLAHALKTLSKETGVTFFMTLLAAFNILLSRLTGRNDIVVGSPVAGRDRSETEKLIGIFLNSIVFRTDLSGNPTFRELLTRVRDVTLGAYDRQDLPFEKLLEELHFTRALSHTPLFQVFVNMYNFEDFHFGLEGLMVTRLEPAETVSMFDLTLYIREQSDLTHLRVSYNADLFESGTIKRLLGHYRTLLEGIVADPDRAISGYPLLTQDERRELATRRNVVGPTSAFVEFKKEEIEQSIAARFEQQARLYPDKAAVKSQEHQWSYDELNRKANRIARTIVQERGCGEERVALLFGHGAPMIAGILSVLKSAKSYVPLEPSHPQERIAYILEDSQAGVILTERANLELARTLAKGTLQVIDIDEIDPATSTENPAVAVSPGALAYILYTSGSTGQPKGVMQNQRNVLHHIRCYTNSLHIASADKLTLFSSYGFDAAVMDTFGALLNGATLYPLDMREKEPVALRRRIVEEAVTIYHSTPTVYRYLCDGLSSRADLTAIRLVVLGGEEIQKADIEVFKKYFSKDCILVNGLGPTESTLALQCFIDHESKLPGKIVPVGYPVQDTEVLLLNEAGMDAEVYGEIGVRSEHVALGYWRRLELTRAAFFPDSQGGSRRLYRTGDMGRLLPDGSIVFLGRRDSQVKIRGFRIELGEIEAALYQHAAVREAVVVAREDTPTDPSTNLPSINSELVEGRAGKRLVAYVVASQESAPTMSELRGFLQRKLPNYMIPSAFVFLDSLPLTPNGKIDREALPLPDLSRPELETAFVAPRTPVEQILATIWCDILELERVGVNDNFFDVGGHSLLATRVVSRARNAFEMELPLRCLFEYPTVGELAAQIAPAQAQKILPEKIAGVLAALESLSDDEAERLLARESSTVD